MYCCCLWVPKRTASRININNKKLHLDAAEWSKNMNWSGLSKRFAALALSSMIVASSTTSVLALQLPPDDDEDEDEIEYSRSEALEASIEAQQNGTYGIHNDEDDQDDDNDDWDNDWEDDWDDDWEDDWDDDNDDQDDDFDDWDDEDD